jgi:hypothetical protein
MKQIIGMPLACEIGEDRMKAKQTKNGGDLADNG